MEVALRASPDADEARKAFDVNKVNREFSKVSAKTNSLAKGKKGTDSPHSDAFLETRVSSPAKKQKKFPTKSSIAAKKGADEIKAFKAEQAAKKASETKVKKEETEQWDQRVDSDGDEAAPAEDVDILKKEAGRPPPVNSQYLPLPWKGRLGYVNFHFCDSRKTLTYLLGLP